MARMTFLSPALWVSVGLALLLGACTPMTMVLPTPQVRFGDVFDPPRIVPPLPTVPESTVTQDELAPLAGTRVLAPIVPKPVMTVEPPRPARGGLPTYRNAEGLTLPYDRLRKVGVPPTNLVENPFAQDCPYSVFYAPLQTDNAYALVDIPPENPGELGRGIFVGSRNLDYPLMRFLLAHECGHLLLGHMDNPKVVLTPELAHQRELEADAFACRFLIRKGEKDNVLDFVAWMKTQKDVPTPIHPVFSVRVALLELCLQGA